MIVRMHLIDLWQVNSASRDAMAGKPHGEARRLRNRKKGEFPTALDCLFFSVGGGRLEGRLAKAKGELAPLPCLPIAIASVQ